MHDLLAVGESLGAAVRAISSSAYTAPSSCALAEQCSLTLDMKFSIPDYTPGCLLFAVIITALVAASGGLLFGFDNGITGGGHGGTVL